MFLAACARERLPVFEPADLPVSPVLERLEKRRNHFSSLRAAGTVRLKGEKQNWSGKAFLVGKIPRSLRLEVVSFLGQPLLYVASDGNDFLTWVPGQNRAYQGLASGGILACLIEVPLDDHEALLLMAGVVPAWRYQQAGLFKEQHTENLVLVQENYRTLQVERIWLEGEDLSVIRVERFQDGKLQWEARFDDFVAVEGYTYPKQVEVESAGVRLSLHYRDFAVNKPLERDTFRLHLPAGVEIVPWSAASRN
ncbi:MAG: LolA family protein [Syntrophobacteria bacterium]